MTTREMIKTLIKINIELAVHLGAAEDEEAEKHLGNMCGDLISVIDALCDEIEETHDAR